MRVGVPLEQHRLQYFFAQRLVIGTTQILGQMRECARADALEVCLIEGRLEENIAK